MAFLVCLAACTVPVPFAEEFLFSTERSQLPEASDCERCHEEIYREWTDSAHARAWTSEAFVALTADYTADECLSCHAPGPLGAQGEIALRDDHRHEGVTCISCHLSRDPGDGRLAMRGPYASPWPVSLEIHPMVMDPLFRQAELCGTCHESILAEWRMSPAPAGGLERRTCQSCHMPAVLREAGDSVQQSSDPTISTEPEEEIGARQHSFSIPAELWEHVDVSVLPRRVGEPLRIRIENGLPHGVPAGEFGRRELRIRVRWQAGVAQRVLRADLGQAIPAGAVRVFAFPGVPDGADWAVLLERRNPERAEFVRVAGISRARQPAVEADR